MIRKREALGRAAQGGSAHREVEREAREQLEAAGTHRGAIAAPHEWPEREHEERDSGLLARIDRQAVLAITAKPRIVIASAVGALG